MGEPTQNDATQHSLHKYVLIEPVVVMGAPDAHHVWLKVTNQKFSIGDYCDTKEEAEWMRDMFCIALDKLIAANG